MIEEKPKVKSKSKPKLKTKSKPKRKDADKLESNNNKKKCTKDLDDKKEGNNENEKTNKVAKKRGPRSGFLNDMVNNRVQKILTDSNVPYEIENGTIVFKNNNNKSNNESNEIEVSDSIFNIFQRSSSNSSIQNSETEVDSKDVSDIIENNLEKLSNFYHLYLNSYDNVSQIIDNTHKILSFDEFSEISVSSNIKFTNTNKVKLSDQSLIESTSDALPNIVHLDFNMLTDYFKYAHCYAPIVQPTVLVYRIKNRTLSPGLLLAIYAMTYLFHPNQNRVLADFYFDKAEQYLTCNINSNDIQNVHTAYLLSNYCPGTNKSYIFSGVSMRLLKALNLFDDLKLPGDFIFYEERVKTIWGCIGKDSLLNISCNRLDRPGWLDQPIPQALTDSEIIKKYTPERLTIVYMAIVVSLTKIVRHVRERRKNIFDKNEFKYLMEELNLIQKHLEKHISFSQNKVDIKSCPQLSCVVYHYTLFFTAKLILFNFELSPYVYTNTLIRTKKYVKMKRKEVPMSNMIHLLDKYCLSRKGNSLDNLNIKNIKQNSNHIPVAPSSLISTSTSSNIMNDNNNVDSIIDKSTSFSPTNIKSVDFLTNNHLNNINNSDNLTTSSMVDISSIEKSEESTIENDYINKCILSKLTPLTYNYRFFDENNNDAKIDNEDDILEIPHVINNLDYENCFNVCFDVAEKVTKILNILIESFNNSQIKFQNSLCWSFYYIGTFYMMVYANFKREDVKDRIEFYHNQIKAMYKIFPLLSFHYSKLYEEAKLEAYEAFSNDSIVFYQKGPF